MEFIGRGPAGVKFIGCEAAVLGVGGTVAGRTITVPELPYPYMGLSLTSAPGEGLVPNARRRTFRMDEHADAVRARDKERRGAGQGDGRTTSTEGSTPGVCGKETGRLRGNTGISSLTRVSEEVSDSTSVYEEEDGDGERRRIWWERRS